MDTTFTMTMQEQPAQDAPELQKVQNIVKQLQGSQNNRLLLSSREALESFRTENFKLKVQVYNLRQSLLKQASNHKELADEVDTGEVEADLIAELLKTNESLKKQIEDNERRDRKEQEERQARLVDRASQTNLDGINIEELLKCRVALRKQRETRSSSGRHDRTVGFADVESAPASLGYNHHHQTQQMSNHEVGTHHQQQYQQQQQQHHHLIDRPVQTHKVMTQLHYPIVAPPAPLATSKQQVAIGRDSLSTEEEHILETLYRVDGIMTTVLGKMRAANSDRQAS